MSNKPILAFVGPLGSGKTTLARNTLRAKVLPGRWAYLINDSAPSSDMVDGAVDGELAEIAALAGGCFTCENPEELGRRIREAIENPAVAGVMIEGFGSVAGTETVSALQQIGIPFHVVATLDARNHARNLAILGHVVATQVAAATIGIGVTKAEAVSIDDPSLDKLRTFVENVGSGKPLFIVPPGSALPEWAVSRVLARPRRALPQVHRHHDGCCGHDHGHEHHHHGHRHHGGLVEQSIRLRHDATLASVTVALEALKAYGVFRAKGATEGWQFHLVHDDFTRTERDHRHFLAWFVAEPVDTKKIAALDAITEREERLNLLRTQDMLRDDEAASPEESARLIAELMSQIPSSPVVNRAGNLVTHPEQLQLLKEIARRRSVAPTHFGPAIKRCMQYWLAAAALLREQEARWDPRDLANNKRELGISLTWWAMKNAADLGDDLCRQVAARRPWILVAEGMMALDLPYADPDKGWWQAEEFRIAVEYAKAHGGDLALLAEAAEHVSTLYKQRRSGSRAAEHWASVTHQLSS